MPTSPHAFVDAIVDVLAVKSLRALEATGLQRLVVAGGVGANAPVASTSERPMRAAHGTEVYFPPLDLCTDNGAMIALAGLAALRRIDPGSLGRNLGYAVHPRWSLAEASRLMRVRHAASVSGCASRRCAVPCPPSDCECWHWCR